MTIKRFVKKVRAQGLGRKVVIETFGIAAKEIFEGIIAFLK